jgi:hypothetical protein
VGIATRWNSSATAELSQSKSWSSFGDAASTVINLKESQAMGRYMLLWLLGVPIPILLLIWAFGGLH